MSNASGKTGVQCPIGLFDAQEAKIEALTKAINAAQTAPEKMPYARDLIDEIEVLLVCPSYDRTDHNCGLCRSFSKLRLQTASLIVKVGTPGIAHESRNDERG